MKTFLTAVGIVFAVLLVGMSGDLLKTKQPTYGEIAWQNALQAEQLRIKQGELDDIKQGIKDGLVPCKSKEKP